MANATKVPNVETFGKSDPYITVEFQGEFCNFRKVTKLLCRSCQMHAG